MSTISKGEQEEESGKILEELHDLLRLAEKGEEDAVPEIRQILNEHPDLAWRFVDVAHIAEDALIEEMTKEGDLAAKELIRCQLEAMREQIAGNNSPPLERLLSERVVLTWLELQLFEALYAKNMPKLTIAQAEHHQKRLDRAHRRHLSAIGALAQIRKLLKGTAITQINIADKQINTTG
jgi:CRP-like cAMP-binding protein